jgi:hypothetical protein
MGKAIIRGSVGSKLLELLKPKLAQVMTILTPDEETKFIVIDLAVSSAHYSNTTAYLFS